MAVVLDKYVTDVPYTCSVLASDIESATESGLPSIPERLVVDLDVFGPQLLLQPGQGLHEVVPLDSLGHHRQPLALILGFRPAFKDSLLCLLCFGEEVSGYPRVGTRKGRNVRAGFFGERHGVCDWRESGIGEPRAQFSDTFTYELMAETVYRDGQLPRDGGPHCATDTEESRPSPHLSAATRIADSEPTPPYLAGGIGDSGL